MKWEKKTLKLNKNHSWRVRQGYKLFIADRGLFQMAYPQKWIFDPGTNSFKFMDRKPPADNCTLELTIFPHPQMAWSGLSLDLEDLLRNSLNSDEPLPSAKETKSIHIHRPDLDIFWLETRYMEANENREACQRNCLGRGASVHFLMTYLFWGSDEPRFHPVWLNVLESIQTDLHIEDCTQGVRLQ